MSVVAMEGESNETSLSSIFLDFPCLDCGNLLSTAIAYLEPDRLGLWF